MTETKGASGKAAVRRRGPPQAGNSEPTMTKARKLKPVYGELNVRDRRFYINDNLRILRSINTGVFHLVYIDPPYKSEAEWQGPPGSVMEGAKFSDRWFWDDGKQQQLEVIRDYNPGMYHVIEASKWSDSPKMAGYLVFMGIRLIEFHRVLRPGGAMYLHCDHDANSYLRQMMNIVFGPKAFRAVITWKRHTGGHNDSKRYGDICDTILYYVKDGAKETWNQQYRPYTEEEKEEYFRLNDDDGKGPYSSVSMIWPNNKPGKYHYDYKGYKPHRKGWRMPLETMERWDSEGRIIYPRRKTGRLRRKKYLSESEGVPYPNLWADITSVQANSLINTDYPTQKPRELLHRIIQTSTNPGDWVLDGFAGCGTTAAACETIGDKPADWAANKRNWVGIDLGEYSADAVIALLQQCTLTRSELKGLSIGIKPLLDWRMLVKIQRHIAPRRTDLATAPVPVDLLPQDVTVKEAPWKQLTYRQQREYLMDIQATDNDLVTCPYCGRSKDPDDMELDHIVPKVRLPVHTIDNRMLICGTCNGTKGGKLDDPDAIFDQVVREAENQPRRMYPGWTRQRMHARLDDIKLRVSKLISDELAGPTIIQMRQW